MRRVILALVLACASQGCLAEIDEEPTEETVTAETDKDSSGGTGLGGGHNTGCGYETIELFTLDGETHEFTYPIPCNPYYIYGGMPPEDEFYNGEDQQKLPQEPKW